MLTNHKYELLTENWDEGTIATCCKKDPPEDPKCTDCCYDDWREQLKNTVQVYNSEKEDADQTEKRLVFVTDRRNRYRTWHDELKKLEELSLAICNQLDVISIQSHKIWYSACNAVKAIEVLFCMIREFYSRIDSLKNRYDELQICISKNNDPSLEKGKGILGCLDTYLSKLEAITKVRDEIIKALLESVKLSNLLQNNIYTLECLPTEDCSKKNKNEPCKPVGEPCNCSSDSGAEYGFRTIICQWYCSFKCNEPCPDPDPCKDQQQIPAVPYKQPKQNACEIDCEPNPVFAFPICKDSYSICVDKWYTDDDKCVKYLNEELKKKNKNKEALQACKQSLEKAIAEANPKNRC